mgnify:FL=1
MVTNKEGVESMINIMVDYKKGRLNMGSAMEALEYATDLGPKFNERMLRESKRENVVKLRDFNEEPK